MTERIPRSEMHFPRQPGIARAKVVATACVILFVSACGRSQNDSELISERIRCVIDTTQSHTVLQLDTTITFDQPDLFYFAIDSRDQVYASPTRGGALLHWSAEGMLQPLIGTTGEGPGQFATGPVVPYVTIGDSLYIRDNHLHWVVYDPQGEFVRFSPMGPISASSHGSTQFTDDGLVLSSDQNGSEQYSLLVVGRNGEVVRRVRRLRKMNLDAPPLRAAVTPGDGTYWVGPEIYSRGAYSLELWDSAGNVLRSLKRSVPWYIADSLIRPFEQQAAKSPDDPLARPFLFPRVQQLAWGGDGKLWIVTHVPKVANARGQMLSTTSLAALYSASTRVLEDHVEVLDPATGAIVASQVFDYGFLLMPRARGGVLVTEDSATGMRNVVRYGLRLTDSSGRRCR